MTLNIKRNDTREAIVGVLRNPSGSLVDLTDATVVFSMSKKRKLLVSREAEILDAPNGSVRFSFVPGETSELGTMRAEFKVTYLDGTFERFPNSGYIWINFEENVDELGG